MESSDHKDIPSTSGNADLAGLLAQVDSQVGCFHSAEKLNNDSAAPDLKSGAAISSVRRTLYLGVIRLPRTTAPHVAKM